MGLPNIGPLELIIILAIALLIVGPGRLPEMGNAIGRTIREFRKASTDITDAASVDAETKTPSAAQPNTLAAPAQPNTTTQSDAPTTGPAGASTDGTSEATAQPPDPPAEVGAASEAAADDESDAAKQA